MAKNKLEVVNEVHIKNASNGVIVEQIGSTQSGEWAEPEYSVKTGKEAEMLRKSLGLTESGGQKAVPPISKSFNPEVFSK